MLLFLSFCDCERVSSVHLRPLLPFLLINSRAARASSGVIDAFAPPKWGSGEESYTDCNAREQAGTSCCFICMLHTCMHAYTCAVTPYTTSSHFWGEASDSYIHYTSPYIHSTHHLNTAHTMYTPYTPYTHPIYIFTLASSSFRRKSSARGACGALYTMGYRRTA